MNRKRRGRSISSTSYVSSDSGSIRHSRRRRGSRSSSYDSYSGSSSDSSRSRSRHKRTISRTIRKSTPSKKDPAERKREEKRERLRKIFDNDEPDEAKNVARDSSEWYRSGRSRDTNYDRRNNYAERSRSRERQRRSRANSDGYRKNREDYGERYRDMSPRRKQHPPPKRQRNSEQRYIGFGTAIEGPIERGKVIPDRIRKEPGLMPKGEREERKLVNAKKAEALRMLLQSNQAENEKNSLFASSSFDVNVAARKENNESWRHDRFASMTESDKKDR